MTRFQLRLTSSPLSTSVWENGELFGQISASGGHHTGTYFDPDFGQRSIGVVDTFADALAAMGALPAGQPLAAHRDLLVQQLTERGYYDLPEANGG